MKVVKKSVVTKLSQLAAPSIVTSRFEPKIHKQLILNPSTGPTDSSGTRHVSNNKVED